jgi:hypothetical protein
LAGRVEYSEEGLLAVDEALFDIGVLDRWKPLEGEFVLDESDLGDKGRREARLRPLRRADAESMRRTVRHDLPTAEKAV